MKMNAKKQQENWKFGEPDELESSMKTMIDQYPLNSHLSVMPIILWRIGATWSLAFM